MLNAHITNIPPERERFDTLISPSGTVATLNQLSKNHGVDYMGFDSAFPGPEAVNAAIRDEIESVLQSDDQPILLCTTLIYNAEATLRQVEEIKRDFGGRIKIVLGGQLIPFAMQSYQNNPNIDSVCIGDAEAIFPRLISDGRSGGLRKKYTDWLKNGSQQGKFSFVNYDNFFGLEERMVRQREISGFSQLCIQGLGGPGCSWAAGNKKGACDFCALQNITEMNTQPLEAQMQVEANLQERFAPDRLFDVANQFLPFINPRQNAEWLRQYIQVRNRYGVTTPKYAYLTVASIDDEIAELLREAGITQAYLGIDHFDTDALEEANKSHRTQRRLERTLDALKNNDIKTRMGLVIGSSRETVQSLRNVEEGVNWLQSNYSKIIKSLGVFPIYVLPGSKVYERAKTFPETREIIRRFEQRGYFTKEEEAQLTDIYMRNHSEVSPEFIRGTIEELQRTASKFTISHDYNRSPGADALKA